jgi:DNA-binding PadR family transcriptional regulator
MHADVPEAKGFDDAQTDHLTFAIYAVTISVTDILMEPLAPAVFHILLAVSGGEHHGYAIMREAAAESSSAIKMGPGTLYGTLKRMLNAGLAGECGERRDPAMNEERRRYYRITAAGKRAAVAEAKRLDALVGSARGKGVLA